MYREWIRKEVLARKESRRMSWAAVGQEAGISGQTASIDTRTGQRSHGDLDAAHGLGTGSQYSSQRPGEPQSLHRTQELNVRTVLARQNI